MEIKDIYKKSQSHKIISLDRSRDSLSHAYLIECADKFLLKNYAISLAKEIFCMEDNSPCDKCNNCAKVDHQNMVDLKVYPKEKNIMVDDVLEIVEESIQRPMDSIYKVFILNNFDDATTQAQNKLLKTLEEPPRNVIFILTCASSLQVLPTIISRVKRINEPLLDLKIVEDFLRDEKVEDYSNIARVSGRNIDTALKLSKAGNVSKIIDLAFEMLINLRTSADILKYSSKITALKKDFTYFLDSLIMILRDSAICKNIELIDYEERKQELEKIATIYSKKAIEEIVFNLCEIYNKLEFNCNLVGVVDQMLLDILEVKFLCQ